MQTLCLHCITLNYVTVRPIKTKSDIIFGCSTSFDYAVLIQSSLLNKSVEGVIGYYVGQKAKNNVLDHKVTF